MSDGPVFPAIDRRRVLQLMAASAALAGLPGCGPSQTPENIVPRVEPVADEVAGAARYVATTLVQEGYGTGVLLQHRMARPVKLEGNPDHPASLGAADAAMQAAVLDLYDPERSAAVLNHGQVVEWARLTRLLSEKRRQWAKDGGTGLRLLTGRVTSPTMTARLAALLKQYPAARWHQWEPLSRDNVAAGAELAFGRSVDTLPLFDKADVVLGIESDAISTAPGHLAFARAFAARRRAAETGADAMSRIYAIEPTPTLLGAVADHRFVVKPSETERVLRAVAAAVGAGPAEWRDGEQPHWADVVARDLSAHRGAALVHAGPEQPPAVHALAHAINDALGAPGKTLRHIEPVASEADAGIAELASAMHAGSVDTLLILEANPVFDAPADLGFRAALARVALSVQLTTHADETAQLATFHVPALHSFERWGDARAFDGTASLVQPQIRPLVPGHSPLELLALLVTNDTGDDRRAVQNHWRTTIAGDFDTAWAGWLRQGMVPATAAADADVKLRDDFAAGLPKPEAVGPGLTVLLRPDPFLRDGGQANNGWLQELPRPFTRLTWDNAALVAPATAKRVGIDSNEIVEIAAGEVKLRLPAYVLPGQAEDCVTVPLGYGRTAAGAVGSGVGGDVQPLRLSAALWQVDGASIRRTGERYRLATTQHHHNMAGRDLARSYPLDAMPQRPEQLEQASLYSRYAYTGHAWGMAISLNSCIGCGACVAACQAENNIPVVGRDEVMRERAMHWIRIDRYWAGDAANPDIRFQPVPCMHCEDAPCEVVCPVEATVHDSDGLNAMVYNRCVGTRFCSNNCPYKVRRFNFFAFAHNDPRPAIAWNPDVTVRARGVMEKCTYCIQRIRKAKIAADRDDKPIADGDIVTACQQACPTEAIVFGDLNDSASAVRKRKASPLDYALLGELNTRPRTTYAARVVNRNPDIAEG
jgi:Fe-S-cluster-containing dehydrogenase component/anaerobic selenocysteine-containing dehydrogenase